MEDEDAEVEEHLPIGDAAEGVVEQLGHPGVEQAGVAYTPRNLSPASDRSPWVSGSPPGPDRHCKGGHSRRRGRPPLQPWPQRRTRRTQEAGPTGKDTRAPGNLTTTVYWKMSQTLCQCICCSGAHFLPRLAEPTVLSARHICDPDRGDVGTG